MDIMYIPAKSISYGGSRSLSSILFIVIHYTGNNGDTAKNNCNFFKNGNTRSAGAHFFVSQDGTVCQSILMEKTAYAVGGFVTSKYGAASYYKKCTNTNSVSIELCDNVNKDPSVSQTAAVRELIKHIQKKCPNARTIIRHWDVSGKSCPVRMTGTSNSKWDVFKKVITTDEPALANYSNIVTNTPDKLDVDGKFWEKSIRAWQYIMKTPVDGIISSQYTSLRKYHIALRNVEYGSHGSALIRNVQDKLIDEGAEILSDGQFGPGTIAALQRKLGVDDDGYFGPVTAKALQTLLNTGRF